jgi:hypothetical protein
MAFSFAGRNAPFRLSSNLRVGYTWGWKEIRQPCLIFVLPIKLMLNRLLHLALEHRSSHWADEVLAGAPTGNATRNCEFALKVKWESHVAGEEGTTDKNEALQKSNSKLLDSGNRDWVHRGRRSDSVCFDGRIQLHE